MSDKETFYIFSCDIDIIFNYAYKKHLPKDKVINKVKQRLKEYEKQLEEKNE